MSDEYEDRGDRLHVLFEKHNEEYIKFENIPAAERRHTREDLCAFLYLHEKLGGNGDCVGAAEHDEIFLSFDNLEKLTEEDVLYITRCGVRYDTETDSLAMFV